MKPLTLIEWPLIVMEGSILGEQYMGLNSLEAFEYINLLKERCQSFNGNFALLWHNSSFTDASQFDMYRMIINN